MKKDIYSAKVIDTECKFDFTEESVEAAKKDIQAISESLREKRNEIFEIWEELNKRLPEDLRSIFSRYNLLLSCSFLEAATLRSLEIYSSITNPIENSLKDIFISLINRDGVEKAEEIIKYKFDYALLNQLLINALHGGSQKDLVKRYGKNEAFWTRVKETKAAKDWESFQKVLFKLTKSAEGENFDENFDNEVLNKKDLTFMLRIVSKKETREQHLSEQSEEWRIAEKLGGKGLEFLKSGKHSKETLEKFKKEVLKKG